MGAGASSEKHDRDVLPEAEASVVNRYHIYHAKSMGELSAWGDGGYSCESRFG